MLCQTSKQFVYWVRQIIDHSLRIRATRLMVNWWQGINLLVMGTVCRTRIAGFLIGNTAEEVLSQLHCSALTDEPKNIVTPRRVQELEQVLSRCFAIVVIEHTTKPFTTLNGSIG